MLYSGSKADGSDALDSSSTAAPGLTPANTIWDISYTGTGSSSYLYVSMKSGTLFRYQSIVETESGLSNPLTEVIEVPSSGSSNIILVGTDAIDTTVAEGYYEGVFPNLASGSTNSIVSSTSAVFSTTVGAFPIHGFYYDTVPESGITRLFVFTSPGTTSASYYGLYSSAWDSKHKLWSGWSAE